MADGYNRVFGTLKYVLPDSLARDVLAAGALRADDIIVAQERPVAPSRWFGFNASDARQWFRWWRNGAESVENTRRQEDRAPGRRLKRPTRARKAKWLICGGEPGCYTVPARPKTAENAA